MVGIISARRVVGRSVIGPLVVKAARVLRVAALGITRPPVQPPQVPAALLDPVAPVALESSATVVVHSVSPLGFDAVEVLRPIEEREGQELRAFLSHVTLSAPSPVIAVDHEVVVRCHKFLGRRA